MASEGFRYLGSHDPVHFSVPAHEIDDTAAEMLDLEVMTVSEMRDVRARIATDLP